ncbi:hypothetical protein ACYT7O_10615, partial [Streptococcus pyogenes]
FRKGVLNGNADCLSRPIISFLELITSRITEVSCPINIYKNQLIIKKVSSGSLKIKNETIFNAKRKVVTSKTFDENDALIVFRNHIQEN